MYSFFIFYFLPPSPFLVPFTLSFLFLSSFVPLCSDEILAIYDLDDGHPRSLEIERTTFTFIENRMPRDLDLDRASNISYFFVFASLSLVSLLTDTVVDPFTIVPFEQNRSLNHANTASALP